MSTLEANEARDSLRARVAALEAEVAQLRDDRAKLAGEVVYQRTDAERLRESLEDLTDGAAVTFADERLKYEDVQLRRGALNRARAALAPAQPEEGSACSDRAETVEQTHARWSAQPKEGKP